MPSQAHFRSLEHMYLGAPINALYQPTISVDQGKAEISMPMRESYCHAAGSAHGSIYFKMLDDAAYFAASSLEKTYFIVTASFTTYLTRPISSGNMRAVGRVVNSSRTQFIAEAVVYNDKNKEIARGNGIFVRSQSRLEQASGYTPS